MLYTIEEETLTALGDAIREKTTGQVELPKLSVENQYISYNKAYPYSLPSFVKKVKIIGNGNFGIGGTVHGTQGLGIAPGVFSTTDERDVREAEGYVILKERDSTHKEAQDQREFNFEITIEGNAFAFVATENSSSPKSPNISFEAIGLDENGKEFKYTSLEMIDEINGLNVIPDEGLTITGNCSYRFTYNGWNWFINGFGDKITTKDIALLSNAFSSSNELEYIPFSLNTSRTITVYSDVFSSCYNLKSVPYIIGPERTAPTGSYNGGIDLSGMFHYCYALREIPEDYFWKIVPNADYWEGAKNYSNNRDGIFYSCYSLRKLPDISILGTTASSYSSLYYQCFYYCYTLDEITNLPVSLGTFTSNYFNYTFNYCCRLKELIFETNEDGTPKTANWKSQTIDLSKYVGYVSSTSYILNYNSGITADKQVIDDATYQALKDDPDYFTLDVNYSRYNHDSAVNTINSLPDTSAYGTNTIKFMGACGSLTDGGAINTLTEEEIAVATAKGWTVSLV